MCRTKAFEYTKMSCTCLNPVNFAEKMTQQLRTLALAEDLGVILSTEQTRSSSETSDIYSDKISVM